MYGEVAKEFRVGERVELHPATDSWMRGDRYGTVEEVGRRYVWVRMDKSRRLLNLLPRNIRVIKAIKS